MVLVHISIYLYKWATTQGKFWKGGWLKNKGVNILNSFCFSSRISLNNNIIPSQRDYIHMRINTRNDPSGSCLFPRTRALCGKEGILISKWYRLYTLKKIMGEIFMISKLSSLNHWSEEWKYHGIQHSHMHLTYPVSMDMSPYRASSDEFTWINLGLEFYRQRNHLLVPSVPCSKSPECADLI